MNTPRRLDPRIENWVLKNFKKSEIILAIVLGVGMILKISAISLETVLLTLSFSTLAILYFLRAYIIFPYETRIESFFDKLLSFGWSICIISILFLIQGWPGYDSMLFAGSLPQIIILIAVFYFKIAKGINYLSHDKTILIRTVIIVSITISLYLCPKEILIKNNIITKQQKASYK